MKYLLYIEVAFVVLLRGVFYVENKIRKGLIFIGVVVVELKFEANLVYVTIRQNALNANHVVLVIANVGGFGVWAMTKHLLK